mmetsp:Transcript_2691/g.3025  ORF Transcript_2691/g.3025 Transcript_2691/m.3025 type:complete len:138 (-) Transcript_2691:60-473(-)
MGKNETTLKAALGGKISSNYEILVDGTASHTPPNSTTGYTCLLVYTTNSTKAIVAKGGTFDNGSQQSEHEKLFRYAQTHGWIPQNTNRAHVSGWSIDSNGVFGYHSSTFNIVLGSTGIEASRNMAQFEKDLLEDMFT